MIATAFKSLARMIVDLTPTFQTRAEKDAANGYAGLNAGGELVGTIIHRKDTAAALATVVLSAGEWGYAINTKKVAIGDGVITFANLANAITDVNALHIHPEIGLWGFPPFNILSFGNDDFGDVDGTPGVLKWDGANVVFGTGGGSLVGILADSAILYGIITPSETTLAIQGLSLSNSFDAVWLAAGVRSNSAGTPAAVAIKPTLNQTGTAGHTALRINVIQTAVGSGQQNLIDAQVGGVSKSRIDNLGNLSVNGNSVFIGRDSTNLYSGLWLDVTLRTTSNYALLRDAGTATIFNAPTGESLIFRINNANRLTVSATGMGFNGTGAVAKPAVTGSRGGNAALASLLTALANYGLVTDSTTA